MSQVIVRPAEVIDAHQIAEIHIKTWQYAYKGLIPDAYLDSLSIEKRTETWEKQLRTPIGNRIYHTFVAEINDQIVGWCSVGKSRDEDATEDTGELLAIYVHPDFIGTGCGSKLMESAINLLKKDGYKKATLWVLDTNQKTRKWYESKGWKVEGKTKIDKRDSFELNETRYIIKL